MSPLFSQQNLRKTESYVFRACFTDIFEGHILGKFAADNLGVKRAAIFFDVASEVLKSQSELFKNSFEKNDSTVVAYETYTTGDKDFSAQLTKINKEGMTILLVEQNANMALHLASRGHVLETGSIIFSGTGRELRDNPIVRTAYLGTGSARSS